MGLGQGNSEEIEPCRCKSKGMKCAHVHTDNTIVRKKGTNTTAQQAQD
jgi:hypothetical protein